MNILGTLKAVQLNVQFQTNANFRLPSDMISFHYFTKSSTTA